MIATRPADVADRAFVEQTFLATLREPIAAARGGWDEAREREQFQSQLELRHTEIVQHDGVDVGFVMVVPTADGLNLHTLCLIAQSQSQGIGTQVTNRILRFAQQRNLRVTVSVLRANGRARSFYERLGFVRIGGSEYHHHFCHVSGAVAA